jgi:hypothetical protein
MHCTVQSILIYVYRVVPSHELVRLFFQSINNSSKHATERQVPAGATNPNILRRVLDDPILLNGVPASDVLARDVEADSGGSVRRDGKSLEASELFDGVVETAAGEVQLRHFVTDNRACVLDCSVDAEKNIVQARVATGSATSFGNWLGTTVVCTIGNEVGGAVVQVTRSTSEIARVQPGVVVQRDASEVRGEGVVLGVLAEVAEGRCCSGVASERNVSRGIQVHDLQIRVCEGGVRKTETELVGGSLVVEVKGAVVDDVALLKVELRDSTFVVVIVENVGSIILPVFADGPRELSTGVYAAEQNISDGVTAFLARQTSPENGSDVRVVLVLFKKNRTNRVDH